MRGEGTGAQAEQARGARGRKVDSVDQRRPRQLLFSSSSHLFIAMLTVIPTFFRSNRTTPTSVSARCGG